MYVESIGESICHTQLLMLFAAGIGKSIASTYFS